MSFYEYYLEHGGWHGGYDDGRNALLRSLFTLQNYIHLSVTFCLSYGIVSKENAYYSPYIASS